MSISAILNSTSTPYQFAGNPLRQQFKQLGQALQSGNLSSAQSDFESLRQAFSQPPTTSGSALGASAASSPLSQAFSQLASDLQSGNLAAAQKDFSTVQQDAKSLNGSFSRFGHHHHHGGGAAPAINSLLQDLNPTAQSQNSVFGNGTGAQAIFSPLHQPLQSYGGGGGLLSSESALSLEA
jgi:hypothetical protein